LAPADGGVDMPLAAFAFEISETFQYHYNLFVPWTQTRCSINLASKPNERMERFLAEQGVFPAQPTTFLSDGGEKAWQPTRRSRVTHRTVSKSEGLPMAWQSAPSPTHARGLLQVRTHVLN